MVDEDVAHDERECNDEVGCSGLYVDLENLHDGGQAMIEDLVEHWPEQVPPPSRLTLYAPADRVELWRLWATSRFDGLEVAVHGTQHFSGSPTKNSADVAIAANAMADLLQKRVTHVAVFSDDSDFISLYVAIRDEPDIPVLDGTVPFLWVVTDREGSLSATVKRFFPPDQLHLVENNGKREGRQGQVSVSTEVTGAAKGPEAAGDVYADMARAVVRSVDVGQFKSTDCQEIIRERWGDHPLASLEGSPFGAEFKNNIWPVLEGWGVKINNPGKNPVRYDMTKAAKQTVG